MRLPVVDGRTGRHLSLLLGATAAAVVAVLFRWPVAAVAGGALLAFVLPGTALVGALFGDSRTLRRLERYVLAGALSLAVLILGGLLLYAVGIRLRMPSWTALTGAVTLAGAAVTYVRAARVARGGTGPRAAARTGTGGRDAVRLARRAAPLALALALLGGAAWVSVASAHREAAATTVTALSIVSAENPDPATSSTRRVLYAVTTQGTTPASFTLEVRGPDGYAVSLTLTVSKRSSWYHTLEVPVTDRVTASLYRGGESTPYRTVYLHGSVVTQ